MDTQTKTLTIFAPAKINLYLHVTGRLDNGYHTLDSLVAFSDIGDSVEIEPAPEFKFSVKGPYAKMFSAKELDASPDSSNLAVQAAWAMSRAAQKVLNVRITLTKNLPLASGLGGGSSDAAAMLWGLSEWWNTPRNAHYMPGLMSALGADVPVCLSCRPTRMRGIGDILEAAPVMADTPFVLVNPGRAEVFKRFARGLHSAYDLPDNLEHFSDLIAFLKPRHNDLQSYAMEIAPEISNVLIALGAQKGCGLARMSGSGATCFGLFEKEMDAKKAAQIIAARNPLWWVKAGWLNRPERY